MTKGAVRPHAEGRRVERESLLRPRAVWQSIGLPMAFARPARFDFRTGVPDGSLFPHRLWRRLVARTLRANESTAGRYGDIAGDAHLRDAIARHLGVSRGLAVSADDITITNGTQQALDLIARVSWYPAIASPWKIPATPPRDACSTPSVPMSPACRWTATA